MKIINKTAEDMTLTHPGVPRSIVGAALLIISVTNIPGAGHAAQAGFVLFVLGLFALFTNANETIDIYKPSGEIRHRYKELLGTKTDTYPIGSVTHVELREPQKERAKPLISEAFIVMKDGSRLLIDYRHRHMGLEWMEDPEAESPASIAARVARFLNVPLQNRNTLLQNLGSNSG